MLSFWSVAVVFALWAAYNIFFAKTPARNAELAIVLAVLAGLTAL
jgi:hypothetical protein